MSACGPERGHRAECASRKNSSPPMQVARRKRCQTRTRPRKKACVYGALVSEATIFAYVGGNPLTFVDPVGLQMRPVPRNMYLPKGPAVTAPPAMSTNNGYPSTKSMMDQFTNMPNPAPVLPDGYTGINTPWTMPNLKQVCVRCAGGDGLPQSCPRIDSPKMSAPVDLNTCQCIQWTTVVVP